MTPQELNGAAISSIRIVDPFATSSAELVHLLSYPRAHNGPLQKPLHHPPYNHLYKAFTNLNPTWGSIRRQRRGINKTP